MKLNKLDFYNYLFGLIVFLQLYLPSFKVNVFIQIFILSVFFFLERKFIISITFFKTIKPLFIIFGLGFIGFIVHFYNFKSCIKDVFHFIKPITGILIGYLFYKKINNLKLFFKTIIIVGFISAIIHFVVLLFFSNLNTVADVREFGRDNFLELFALFFIVFYRKYYSETLFKNRFLNKIITIVLLISSILYFSRTMIVVSIIILFTFYGYTIINKKTIIIFSSFILSVAVLYIYLFSIKLDRNGNSIESFLYKVKIAPSEILKTKINRENHEDLWDHWRGYEAKRAFALMEESPSSYFIGCGFGSMVNLKFFAPLNGGTHKDKGLKYISELHNGYPYVLYKTGFLGLFLYLFFLFKLYLNIYKSNRFLSLLISSIGLVFIFTTITITGVYNSKDIIVFLLGALLFFNEKK